MYKCIDESTCVGGWLANNVYELASWTALYAHPRCALLRDKRFWPCFPFLSPIFFLYNSRYILFSLRILCCYYYSNFSCCTFIIFYLFICHLCVVFSQQPSYIIVNMIRLFFFIFNNYI